MARINFEDRWWTSAHRKKLIKLAGSEEMADGIAAGWWRLAQEYWGKGRKPVPSSTFELLEAGPKLIEAKLARVEADGVYATGAADAFEWLNEKREAGKKGGQKSAQRPRDAKGRLQKKPKQKPSEAQAEAKVLQTSSSSSSSFSSSIIPFSSKTGEVAPLPPDDRNPIGLWFKAYKEKYGVRYALDKKDAGMLQKAGQTHGPDRLEVLFACYLAIKEPLYENAKHPLSLFFRDLQKISVAAQTGVDPSKNQAFDYSRLKD